MDVELILIAEGCRVPRTSVRAARLEPSKGDFLRLVFDVGGKTVQGFDFVDAFAAARWLRQRFPFIPLTRIQIDGSAQVSVPAVPEPPVRCESCD